MTEVIEGFYHIIIIIFFNFFTELFVNKND
jgi:hypothetical protein